MMSMIPFWIHLLTRSVFVLISLVLVLFDKICVLMKILNAGQRSEGPSSLHSIGLKRPGISGAGAPTYEVPLDPA